MSLRTTERLPGVNPGDITIEGVGTLKLDVALRDEGANPADVLPYRNASGKMTVSPGHPYFDQVEQVFQAPERFGLRAESAPGGNIANMGGYYAAVGARMNVNAFYDSKHPTAVEYTSLAAQYGVPLRPVEVSGMQVATNIIVRHNGERQVLRYVPEETIAGPEHIDELVSRVEREQQLVVVTSAGAVAAHAAISATPRDTLLAYTPGRELDDQDDMDQIVRALYQRRQQGGRTLLSLNKEEGQQVTGHENAGVVAVAREIGRQGLAQTVYITDGPNASVMGHGDMCAVFQPPRTQVHGTSTGAGDRGAAFIALSAAVTAGWTSEGLYAAQEDAYHEVLPVLQVDSAMGDLPLAYAQG